jgi:hypothetical protein
MGRELGEVELTKDQMTSSVGGLGSIESSEDVDVH